MIKKTHTHTKKTKLKNFIKQKQTKKKREKKQDF